MARSNALFDTCHWGACDRVCLDNAVLCEIHIAAILREPLGNFVPFLRSLPVTLDAPTLGAALYHAVHTAVHIGLFNRYLGHDLLRAANASRAGEAIDATIDKLANSIGARERGEFMMHLKRQLVVPERRAGRREDTD